jgi:hypothetical protein
MIIDLVIIVGYGPLMLAVGSNFVRRHWYLARLLQRARTDPTLGEAFLRVLRLEKPPATLLRPTIAWRVLRPTVDQVRLPSLGRSVKG